MSQASELIASQFSAAANVKNIWGNLIFLVESYGAVEGQESTSAIQAAINAAGAAGGGIVKFKAKSYLISSTLIVGNGSPTTQSTYNGVRLEGISGGLGADYSNQWNLNSTRLIWTGAAGGIMCQVKGPTYRNNIMNIMFDCATIAATGLKVVHAMQCNFEGITVTRYTGTAYIVTVEATAAIVGVAYGCADNRWTQIVSSNPTNNTANGMLLDGSTSANLDVARNYFNNFDLVYGGAAGSWGLKLAFADNNTFAEGLLYPGNGNVGGSGIVFVQQSGGLTGFPLENVFINVVPLQGVSGTSGTSGNYFLMYPTSDSAPIPTMANVYVQTYDGKFYDGGNQVRRMRQISNVSNQTVDSTTSTTDILIPLMTRTLTTKAGKVKVEFSGNAAKTTAGNGILTLYLDGVAQGQTTRNIGATGFYGPVSLTTILDVTAGAHTVEVRWKSSDVNTVNMQQKELILTELY